ncbi:hypothetical protein PG996_005238 [Apiospora saccharicola]|uniref:Helicase ATP-binding domain-containing protein n=1 Tax=Apiospora saccharicola TaxID=335842 RepID=A0ABR1VKX3_9PEZI
MPCWRVFEVWKLLEPVYAELQRLQCGAKALVLRNLHEIFETERREHHVADLEVPAGERWQRGPDTDRVVLELCSIEGLPDGIDEKIHKGKITGSFLVNNITNEDTRRILYDTLGIGDVEYVRQRVFLYEKISHLQARSAKAAKRQAEFDRSDNKRSEIDVPICSTSAFSQPTGSSEEPSRAEPQVGDNGDDGVDQRDDENFEDSAGDPAEEPKVEEEDTQDAADKDLPNYTDFTDAHNGWCEKLWVGTCELFGCDKLATNAAKVNIAGIQTSLNHYQAMGVFILLTQQAREGIAGGLLAGDMGMGKTLQMLALMVIRGHLVQIRDHIHQNRDCHLPTFKHQKPGDKCPRQDMYGGLQCPCEKDGWARRIAATTRRWPTIVFMPRDLINNWVAKIKKHIDIGPASPANDFEFKVNHDKWSGQAKDPANQRFFYEEEDLEGVDHNEKGLLPEYLGGERTCFLASASIQGRGRFPENLPAGLIVMDEAHRYLGSGSPTAPFTFLENMRKKCDGPVFLFLVSGSLQAAGPDAWFRAADHFTTTARDHDWEHYSETAFRSTEKSLLRRLHWTDKTEIREQLAPNWNEHSALRDKVVKQIIVRRDQKTTDHSGNPIVTFTAPDVAHMDTPMATQGETWSTFCRVVASSVEMELLHGRARANAKGSECYSVIARSATFPTIARLWFTRGLTTDQLMAPTVNELASKDRHAALELLEDSPFWEHRRLLRAESPKYRRLHGRIKEMLALEEPEHMIIFALYPVTCLITLLLLRETSPGSAHGKDGYSRQATLDALESREHPQVVLMTYQLGSVGFNLQEANWLTMLEEPNTHAHATQAPARVHRKGQRRETHIEAFRDEVNLAEKYLVRKNTNRDAMDQGLDWSMYETDGQQEAN